MYVYTIGSLVLGSRCCTFGYSSYSSSSISTYLLVVTHSLLFRLALVRYCGHWCLLHYCPNCIWSNYLHSTASNLSVLTRSLELCLWYTSCESLHFLSIDICEKKLAQKVFGVFPRSWVMDTRYDMLCTVYGDHQGIHQSDWRHPWHSVVVVVWM